MKAKKGLFAALVAVLCAIAIVCGALLGSLARLHTRDIVMMDESAEAVDGGLSFAVEPLAASNAVGVQRVTATVTPAGTAVVWSLSWQNAGDGRDIDAYLTIDEVSGNAIDLTCLQRFTGTAVLKCAFEHNPSIYDTCTVTAEPEPEPEPEPTPSGELSEKIVGVFYLQDVEDEQYVSDVSALISEMQSNAGDVRTHSPATTGAIKGPDFWEPMVNGEVDVSIIYDHYDTIYTNLPQNIYEEYPDANLFYANISTTAAQELEADYSGGAVKACFIGEMTYEDMANTSDDGTVISTDSTIVLNDITGMNTVGFVTSILDNECGDYQVIDIDGDAYLNGEYNIFDDFDPNDYSTIVVTDSRILEYLAPDLDSYGFGGNVFVAYSDGSEDYSTLFPNGNYKAFLTELDASAITFYLKEYLVGISLDFYLSCKTMTML